MASERFHPQNLKSNVRSVRLKQANSEKCNSSISSPSQTNLAIQPGSQSRSSSRTAFSPPIQSPLKRHSSLANQLSRPSLKSSLNDSPKKSPSKFLSANQTQNQKTPTSRSSSKPIWNSSKTERNLPLNLKSPSPTRNCIHPQALKPNSLGGGSSDSSFGNLTFVSAASGIDENRPLPSSLPLPLPPSPGKSKDLKFQQASILSGLGFGRNHQTKSPSFVKNPLIPSSDQQKAGDKIISSYDPKKEPIKAYLRIRPPNISSNVTSPYIEILNDTEVLLIPPSNPSTSNFNPQDTINAKYKFTRVYGPQVSQKEFFDGTGLGLVSDLLQGKSSLCFAYGVTASGKTYTIQGGLDNPRGGQSADPGLLPRTMDVLFNSIGSNQTDLKIKPSRLTAIEIDTSTQSTSLLQRNSSLDDPSFSQSSSPSLIKDDAILSIDSNSDYGVWLSYAEVYNEKIYDLLDSLLEASSSSAVTSTSFTANIAEQVKSAAQLLHNKALHSGGVLRRKALVLKHDKAGGSKYVHGLTEIRVRNPEEAKAIIRHGQVNRTVFSTYANRTSSRSHGIFTIKLIKIPKIKAPTENLLSMATVSRLSIVDLAGSERTRNTQTTGQRLKEAGNINKSLMVLGQCMETLRKNQELKERQRKLAIVPFRHSKLTELFESFFTGEGKTVMIVNVNPCDTGFDENSHVMKFSAVASEVLTIREAPPSNIYQDLEKSCIPPQVAESSFILEDDEGDGEENEGGTEELNENDAFVDHLLEQVSKLRVKLVEAEIRTAMIESEVREKVMQEYNQRMLEMEALFVENMAMEAKEAELKADKKIDIFNRATQHVPNKPTSAKIDSSFEADDDLDKDEASGIKRPAEELNDRPDQDPYFNTPNLQNTSQKFIGDENLSKPTRQLRNRTYQA
ncbi:hypothetical protein O181_043950 [Austropuccinia psidii MF-1]|uniref:Kinesin-like protein n=1 Tax=Austropuccinia psidii MF-1 TaxID=1389203 RepID=A0A9Q3HJQ4_9BASI|nr:hypothetical protein [Austropuccinia psidii MF-1]